jgi:hypothetical protein
VHRTGYGLQIDLMSGINAYARRGKEKKWLFFSSFNIVLANRRSWQWMPAELLPDYFHSKYSTGDEIEFKTSEVIWELSNLLPHTSKTSNSLEIENGIVLINQLPFNSKGNTIPSVAQYRLGWFLVSQQQRTY